MASKNKKNRRKPAGQPRPKPRQRAKATLQAAPRRGALFYGLLLVAIPVTCELLAVGFFAFFGHRFPFPNPERYLATAAEIDSSVAYFDADLGWKVPYETPYGERPRQQERGRARVAAFGDSFVYGEDVSHPMTWPEQLAGLIDADVYNFGCGAYGMDQALLRFEQDFPQRPAEVAIFGFISYDIRRNVSVYRKFQRPEGGFVLTKPRFLLTADGGLEHVANPLPSLDELRLRLREPEFIERLGTLDHWYNPHHLPPLGWPRLATLLSPAFWRYAGDSQPPELWQQDGEARQISERILSRFHDGARARWARPLLLHLPVAKEALDYAERGQVPPAAQTLLDLCQRQGYNCLAPVTELGGWSRQRIATLYKDGLRGGHLTPAGNRWVAEQVAAALAEKGSS